MNQEEKEILFKELSLKEKLSKRDVLELLFEDAWKLDMNYEKVEGNVMQKLLYSRLTRKLSPEVDMESMILHGCYLLKY